VEVWGNSEAQLQLWLLFGLRAAGFVFSAPVFSARMVPLAFRLYLAFLLAGIAFSAWAPAAPLITSSAGSFALAAINELLIGLALGFVVSLVLAAFQLAGTLAGYQMGLAIVNVLDPQSQQQVSLLGDFFFVCATVVFLELNFHLGVLKLWFSGFQLAPVGQLALQAPGWAGAAELMQGLLLLGLKIAMPLVLFLLLMDVALGILARVVPQLNIFVVGTTVKSALGMLILGIVLLQFGTPLTRGVADFNRKAVALLSGAAGTAPPGASVSGR
jgi:flagellar biosynthetic protein FliR